MSPAIPGLSCSSFHALAAGCLTVAALEFASFDVYYTVTVKKLFVQSGACFYKTYLGVAQLLDKNVMEEIPIEAGRSGHSHYTLATSGRYRGEN